MKLKSILALFLSAMAINSFAVYSDKSIKFLVP
jgi:hypothetical protein